MKIVILDANTIGEDISTKPIELLGDCTVYQSTSPDQVQERLADCDVVVLNKVKLGRDNLKDAKSLKLICLLATGYDNVDIDYCRQNSIAVCNVEGYSSHSVSQITVAMVLELCTHLGQYTKYVSDGSYTKSGVANRLYPVYHELCGKVWGIVGYGSIGKEVGAVARALGCKVIVNKRTPEEGCENVDIDTLCQRADIITLHTPLSDSTYHLINKERLGKMKKDVILVNTARGAVTDEEAVAAALESGSLKFFGTDVYSLEPFDSSHPMWRVKDMPNVLLTPHMAWGAYESRERCVKEVAKNISAFFAGNKRNRVDNQ